MVTYVRYVVRPRGKGRRQTIILESPKEQTLRRLPVVVGEQVNKEGVRIGKKHIIDREVIVSETPLKMDLTYGELVMDRERNPGVG